MSYPSWEICSEAEPCCQATAAWNGVSVCVSAVTDRWREEGRGGAKKAGVAVESLCVCLEEEVVYPWLSSLEL